MNFKFLCLLVLVLFQVNISFGIIAKVDTAVINKWIDESNEVIYVKPEIASLYIDSVYSASSEIGYQFGIYKSHNSRAIVLFMTGQYEKSIEEYLKALPYADEELPYQEVRLYSNIAYSLRSLGFQDSAIYYTLKASQFSQENGLEEVYQQSVLDLAYIYMNKDDFIKAAQYYNIVSDYIELSSDKEFL